MAITSRKSRYHFLNPATTAAATEGAQAMTIPAEPVLRAYRFALDPTSAQLADLARHAGAQRWAYNYALARKVEAHQAWRGQVDTLVAAGTPESEARKRIKAPVPNAAATGAHWRCERGDAAAGIDGVCPWW